MAAASIDRVVADFRDVAASLPGAGVPWLRRVREDALDRFADRGFPTARDEDWKYTNVGAIERRHFRPAIGGSEASPSQLQGLTFPGLACHLLVFVYGRFDPVSSSIGSLPSGVKIATLSDVIARDGARLAPQLTGDSSAGAFAALNTAFMSDGVVIELAPGAVVERPIHLLYLATRPDAGVHYRNLVLAEANAEATIVEHYAGPEGAQYCTNVVTTIVAGRNSSIEHYKLQQEGTKAYHVGGLHAAQERDSRFTSHSIALGGAIARSDITTRLGAEGAECTLNGLYMVSGKQLVDHHTRVDHARPRGTSREYYRGVLDGAARGVFNGKVVVHADAQQTDAEQVNHNLLLSRTAEVDTKPQLEIFADDVKCAHGATVGQLDDNMIFYLRSRGIETALARALLIYAFAHDIIGRIRVQPLKLRLERHLISALPEGSRIEDLV